LYRHWHGEHSARDALYIGAAYGRSCVGCCWALTLVMFALGSGSLAWMLGLGLFMSIEKAADIGRELTVLVGVVLVAAGAWVGASG
jgi:predicted metal-binding membrane protein